MWPICHAGPWGIVLVLAALAGFTAAEEARCDDVQPPAATKKTTRSAAASPLDALRSRSPQSRWENLKQHWEQALGTLPGVASGSPQSPSAGRQKQAAEFDPESADLPPVPFVSQAVGKTEGTKDDAGRRETFVSQGSDLKAQTLSLVQPPADIENVEIGPGPDAPKPIEEIVPYMDEDGDPQLAKVEKRIDEEPYTGRSFDGIVYAWEASNVYSNPLYFEDVPLERYGHMHHDLIQPFASAGLFGVQLLGLPYQMAIDPIDKRMYKLGYYRPGEWAPQKYYQVPLNGYAAFVQGGVTTGLIFAIP